MQILKFIRKDQFEAHSLNSLAVRLKLLASNGRLRRWLDKGTLKAEYHEKPSSRGGSRHLIFKTKHLDSVLLLLEANYKTKSVKLGQISIEALKFRAEAFKLALQIYDRNKLLSKFNEEKNPRRAAEIFNQIKLAR